MIAATALLPEPKGLSFVQWGSIVAEQLATYGIAMPYNNESWKTWVCALFYVPELVAMNIPSAESFENWEQWAVQFIGSVR